MYTGLANKALATAKEQERDNAKLTWEKRILKGSDDGKIKLA